MDLSLAISLVAISVASVFFCEGVSWILIYRTSTYKSLKANIDRAAKKLEGMKSQVVAGTKDMKKNKKEGRVETELKNANRELSAIKMKSTVVVAVCMIGLFSMLNSWYDGLVVARIPFDPPGFVRRLAHKGLSGDDYTDCSMAFLYVLCSMSLRPNIQKLLGFAPPRSSANMSIWEQAAAMQEAKAR